MSKHEMIERIRLHNRGATEEFLGRFDEQALDAYLRRLTSLVADGGGMSVWVRQGSRPAMTVPAGA